MLLVVFVVTRSGKIYPILGVAVRPKATCQDGFLERLLCGESDGLRRIADVGAALWPSAVRGKGRLLNFWRIVRFLLMYWKVPCINSDNCHEAPHCQ
jgi:hypothetical protein